MKTLSVLFTAVACLCFFGCEKKPTPKASGDSGNPLSAPADYLGALSKAKKSADKTTSIVGVDQAVKTFFAEEGRFPKSLDELKTKGVTVPNPPDGMKWDYDPNTGIVKAVRQ